MDPFAFAAERPGLVCIVAGAAVFAFVVYRVSSGEQGTEAPCQPVQHKHARKAPLEPPLRYRILIVMMACCTTACVAYALQPPTMPQAAQGDFVGNVSGTTILYTVVAGFLTTIAAHIFKILDDRRRRAYDLQDRKEARERTEHEAAIVRRELLARAELQRIETIHGVLELTKQHTGNAKKLAELQELLVAIGVPSQAVGIDTNQKVTELVEDAQEKKDED